MNALDDVRKIKQNNGAIYVSLSIPSSPLLTIRDSGAFQVENNGKNERKKKKTQ